MPRLPPDKNRAGTQVVTLSSVQGFTLSFVGQLDGAAWTVEMFDFSPAVNAWATAGTLTGSEYSLYDNIASN